MMATGKKIFLIDDSELMLEMTTDILSEAGFTVISTDTPLGATSTIKKENPDLTLVDVSMPALQGNKIVELVKGHAGTQDNKVLLYSDRESDELEKMASECGADGFIKKTSDAQSLIKQINDHL